MSACRHVFYNNPIFFSKISNEQYCHCRHVGMSAWFYPPPLLPTNAHDIHMVSACRHVFITTLNFLFENFEWTILLLSACQHVGMYSYPIHCRHTLFTFMRRSVIRVVGCFAHTPDILPDFQMKHMTLSACRHGLIPHLYCRQTRMTYIWCRHVGTFL